VYDRRDYPADVENAREADHEYNKTFIVVVGKHAVLKQEHRTHLLKHHVEQLPHHVLAVPFKNKVKNGEYGVSFAPPNRSLIRVHYSSVYMKQVVKFISLVEPRILLILGISLYYYEQTGLEVDQEEGYNNVSKYFELAGLVVIEEIQKVFGFAVEFGVGDVVVCFKDHVDFGQTD